MVKLYPNWAAMNMLGTQSNRKEVVIVAACSSRNLGNLIQTTARVLESELFGYFLEHSTDNGRLAVSRWLEDYPYHCVLSPRQPGQAHADSYRYYGLRKLHRQFGSRLKTAGSLGTQQSSYCSTSRPDHMVNCQDIVIRENSDLPSLPE